MTSILGAGIGIAAAEIARTDFYTDTHTKYAIVGAVAGAIVGASQECVRELKQQSDREEAQSD
ncbi:MAG: hypothetical protein SWY16_11190, partial [Cyanobacteriota bacterium]|nr:hypothetical protein [Cyanobacteriota bacterium]